MRVRASPTSPRREYLSHLRLRLHLDFAGISDPADEPEYFTPNLVTLTKRRASSTAAPST